jgi:hypothetical protein
MNYQTKTISVFMRPKFIICILSVVCSQASFAGYWNIITLDPITFGDNSNLPCLVLDGQGVPHISYVFEDGMPPWVRYAYWNDDNWVLNAVDWWDYFIGQPKIKLDSHNLPYIAYTYDEASLQIAYYDGSNWSIEGVNTTPYNWVFDYSLALNNQDIPNLSYNYSQEGISDSMTTGLAYAHKQGGQWANELVDDSSNDVGEYNSIAIDSQEHPHISYFDWQNKKLKYAKWDGAKWVTSVADTGVYNPEGTSIALDQDDNPHISYMKTSRLNYAYWDGSEWIIQVVDDEIYAGYSSNLLLDSQDRPHISYYDYGNDNLKYAYFDGTSWQVETVDMHAGRVNSLALDIWGRPYIIYEYFDGIYTYLRLAWQGGGLGINLLSFTATPQENAVTLNWQVETTPPMAGGDQIAGFNLYHRQIAPNSVAEAPELPQNKNDWTKVNTSLITGQNPYSYTDCACPAEGGEYKLEAVLADESPETLGTTSCAPAPPSFAITKVYPNPASDVLSITLTLPQAGDVTLELYDLTGRLVTNKEIVISSPGEFTEQLNVSALANGIYTLRATQADLSASENMLVVR